MNRVSDIRKIFIDLYANNIMAGNGTFEIQNAQFIADEPTILGKLDKDYAEKELNWYLSQNLNIDGLEPNTPSIWKAVSDIRGFINSNYGWCIFHPDNGNQYSHAITSLKLDKHSRQAVMIYNRPSMHTDFNKDGMSDFMCTFATQLLIRNDQLTYTVTMRSNDAVFGYKNDLHWHQYVHDRAYASLKGEYPSLTKGDVIWNANSLHVYKRHFHLIEEALNEEKMHR